MKNLTALALLALIILSCPVLAVPQRIVSGMPSVTEILYALDLGDRIVGVTTNDDYPPPARKKEKIGGFFLNLEKVVSLKPDLVIMVEDAQRRDLERFRNYGLPVKTINPHSVKEVLDSISQIGRWTGRERAAAELVARMKRRLAAAQPTGLSFQTILRKRPKVLAIVGYDPLIVVGGGTFIDDIMRQAGAENIAGKSRQAFPQYSLETLINERPEYIITTREIMRGLMRDPRWWKLSAVQGGKVLIVDADVLSRPGPRVIDSVEQIARFIYGKKN